jgi:hypothetical protein
MADEKKKPITFDTPEDRVARIIAANGRAPNLIDSLSDEERDELSRMITSDGDLLPGKVKEADGADVEVSPREAFRLFMVRHNEEKKATDAAFDKVEVKGVARKTTFTATSDSVKPAEEEQP